jgi:hypothetical protein
VTEARDKKKVIFGVLNWGLGHATRSIPLINALRAAGFEPVLASDGPALDLLRSEFPTLESEELPTYGVKYGKNSATLWTIGAQLPRIWQVSRAEHRQLKKLVEEHQPVGVISDNRLGFYHEHVPSVYITHQLKLMLPFARRLISGLHHRYIRKFEQCWVPDFGGLNKLSGEMTDRMDPGVPVHFIGPQSRFQRLPEEQKLYDTCTILSGPEPQRTILEQKLLRQLSGLKGTHLMVRGTKEQSAQNLTNNQVSKGSIEVLDFLSGAELAQKINQSKIVISRSGYSSIMDYCALGNKALLIPTPGQPEQEYLARYMLSRGWFYYTDQERMNLEKELDKAMGYAGCSGIVGSTRNEINRELFGLFQGKGKGGA